MWAERNDRALHGVAFSVCVKSVCLTAHLHCSSSWEALIYIQYPSGDSEHREKDQFLNLTLNQWTFENKILLPVEMILCTSHIFQVIQSIDKRSGCKFGFESVDIWKPNPSSSWDDLMHIPYFSGDSEHWQKDQVLNLVLNQWTVEKPNPYKRPKQNSTLGPLGRSGN